MNAQPASRFKSWRRVLMALLLAGVLGVAEWKGWFPREAHPESPPVITSPAPKPARKSSSAPPARPTVAETSEPVRRPVSGAWEELTGCTLEEDRGNDGDSFTVRYPGGTQTFRLYFVDSPEKYRHAYNEDRLREQGKYFGGLSGEETVRTGEEARDFTLGVLRRAPFTVLTRWEQVYDSERIYAFVTTEAGDLGELLVRGGLARIHTKGEIRPGSGNRPAGGEKKRLQALEKEAQRKKLGGWGKH